MTEQYLQFDRPPFALRLLREGDEEEMQRVIDGDRPHLERFQYWAPGHAPSDREETNRSLQEIVDGRMLRYRLVKRDGYQEEIVGEASLYNHDKSTRSACVGFWIIEQFEGQGIVVAAARKIIQCGQQKWSLTRVLSSIEEGNRRSENLAKALGAHLTSETEIDTDGQQERLLRVWEINL